jgi:hypothetical protein
MRAERGIDRERIGIEVEEPPRPRDENGEIAQLGELARRRTRPASSVRSSNQAGPPGRRTVRAKDVAAPTSAPATARAAIHANSPAASSGPRCGRTRSIAPGAGARHRRADARAAQGRHSEHLADGVVELADARESRRERDVRCRQVGRDEEHPRRVRALRASEGEGPAPSSSVSSRVRWRDE